MGAERPGLRAADAHKIGPLVMFSWVLTEKRRGPPPRPAPVTQNYFLFFSRICG